MSVWEVSCWNTSGSSDLLIHSLNGEIHDFPKQNPPGSGVEQQHSPQSAAPTVATSAHSSRKQQLHRIRFILHEPGRSALPFSTLPTTDPTQNRDSAGVKESLNKPGGTSELLTYLHLCRSKRSRGHRSAAPPSSYLSRPSARSAKRSGND